MDDLASVVVVAVSVRPANSGGTGDHRGGNDGVSRNYGSCYDGANGGDGNDTCADCSAVNGGIDTGRRALLEGEVVVRAEVELVVVEEEVVGGADKIVAGWPGPDSSSGAHTRYASGEDVSGGSEAAAEPEKRRGVY